jgi:hypothetical protein
MAEKEFTLQTNLRTARPRSKRLRELGVSGGTGSGSTVVNVSGGDTPASGDGHTHANKPALDAMSIDADGYEYITRLVEVTDPETGITTTESVTEKVKAGYADKAYDLADDSPVANKFLSKIADDVAAGKITFQQGLIAVGISVFQSEAQFGTFVRSLYGGTGAGIDPQGNAEFESVRVRTYFEAVELIINRLSAIEGDQLLTEADTIDSIDDLGNGSYGLHLHSKYEGYFTAQAVNNVVKGIVNNLGAAALGVTQSVGAGVQMYTSWFRVNSVNPASNYIEVTMYPDAQVPSGHNYPPCELMKIARWGNATDTTRQSCLYLSSTEGRIVHLTGVTRPIISSANYGASFGKVPDFLRAMDLPINPNQDYVYARGLIVQDIIRIDYQGLPIVEYVDRGQYDPNATYYNSTLNPVTGIYETSDVWYLGCKWRCMTTGTQTPPAWDNLDWAMVEGNPEFTVEFADTDYLFDPDRFAVTLRIIAKLYNQIITDDILPADVVWTRYSEDQQGNPRTASDNAWALRRAGAAPGGIIGKSIDLTIADCDLNGYIPPVLRFTATVTLRDGAEPAATDSANFEL